MEVPIEIAQNIYNKTADAIRMMFGDLHADKGAMSLHFDFSPSKLSLIVIDEHKEILDLLVETLDEPQQYSHKNFEVRWLLLNKLLLVKFGSQTIKEAQLIECTPSLSALVAFPLLEELARNASGIWDENGILQQNIGKEFKLTRINSKGKEVSHTYKEGQRLVNFAHKLYLMESVQDQELQAVLKSLSERVQVPMLSGSQKTEPLYEKLQSHRDLWAHGREFYGWEGLFVNLIISLIYWGRYLVSFKKS